MNELDAIGELIDSPEARYHKDQALGALGNPSQAELVTTALEGLDSPDRNVRVLMLRLLTQLGGPRAAAGILRGLSDPKRRVREVAAGGSRRFLDHPEIVARLDAMAADESETNKIRGRAAHMLRMHCRDVGAPATEGMLAYAGVHRLKHIREHRVDELRLKALWHLLELDLTDEIAEALRGAVKGGSRTEAILATRALSGYRVVNVDDVEDGDRRKRIMDTCETAGGGVFYWVKRE